LGEDDMTVSVVKLAALIEPSKEQENFAKDLQQHAFNGALVATVGMTAGTTAFVFSKEDPFTTISDIVIDPNLHFFNGWINISRNVFYGLNFGGGVFAAAATGAFSVGNSIYQAYRNYDFIQKSDQHVMDYIGNVELASLLIAMKKSEVVFVTCEDVIAYSRKQCIKKLTADTITDGATGTVSLAASIFSLGLVIPAILPITAIVTLGVLALGAAATAIATHFNQKLLNNKLDAFAKKQKFQLATANQVIQLNAIIKQSRFEQYDEMAQKVHEERAIHKTNHAILATTLFLKLSSLAKYVVAAIGLIATGALSVVAYARSALDAIINYRKRQKFLTDIPNLIAQSVLPWIDQKAYLFFGQTKLEKYIEDNRERLTIRFGSNIGFRTKTPKEIIISLSTGAKSGNKLDRMTLIKLRKYCTAQLMQLDYEKYCEANHYNRIRDANITIKKYLLSRVDTLIANDVKSAGRVNAAKIAFSTAFGLSIIFPALAGVFAAVSVAMILVSEVVTRVVAHNESAKFKKATAKFLDEALDSDNGAHMANVAGLHNFIGMINPSVTYVKPVKKSTMITIGKLFPETSSDSAPKNYKILNKDFLSNRKNRYN
jgi:hypothetical protein